MAISSIASTSASSSPVRQGERRLPVQGGEHVARRGRVAGAAVAVGEPPHELRAGGAAAGPGEVLQQGLPATSRVPPKPNGDMGLSSTIDATVPGWSIAYWSTTPAPSDQPSRCTRCPAGTRPPPASRACRSSAKSRRPRRASTGDRSDRPKPLRSGARQGRCSPSPAMVSAKNRADDTLPCTSTRTGAPPEPDRSTWVRSRDVATSLASTESGREDMRRSFSRGCCDGWIRRRPGRGRPG